MRGFSHFITLSECHTNHHLVLCDDKKMVAFPSDFVRTRRPMYIGQRVEVVTKANIMMELCFIKRKSKKYGVQCDSDEDKTTTWVDDSDIYAIHLKKNDFVFVSLMVNGTMEESSTYVVTVSIQHSRHDTSRIFEHQRSNTQVHDAGRSYTVKCTRLNKELMDWPCEKVRRKPPVHILCFISDNVSKHCTGASGMMEK